MQINWISGHFSEYVGYGRYGSRVIQALLRAGVTVSPFLTGHLDAQPWLQRQMGATWRGLTLSCVPPFAVRRLPAHARHWLLTMTEGSDLPDGWAKEIADAHIERVIVPCEANAETFRRGLAEYGYAVPVHVVPGGTDPDEFPLLNRSGRYSHAHGKEPYVFLTLADRGERKGWSDVWRAFYLAFGSPDTDGYTRDVRLIVKARPEGNNVLEMIHKAYGPKAIADGSKPDPRVEILIEDIPHPADLYARVDCLALPSRHEGWGMPHREAAMMGLPVITQAVGGLDDGAGEWALVLRRGKWQRIPRQAQQGGIAGEWLRADVDELAAMMRHCYDNPQLCADGGAYAAAWLRANQTWDHAAQKLIALIRECETLSATDGAAIFAARVAHGVNDTPWWKESPAWP